MKFSIISVALLLAIISTAQAVTVNVSVYYEAICLGCKYQFLYNLVPAHKAIGQYMDIDFVPFGNAYYSPNHEKVICQHGEAECYGNAVHACAQDILEFDTAFEYIKCMFETDYTHPVKVASKCAESMNLDYGKIQTCAKGDQGRKLIDENAKKTYHLNPHKQYVPWDTINGKHVGNVDFTKYICENFLKDQNVPACN